MIGGPWKCCCSFNTDSSHGSTELCYLWPNIMELAASRIKNNANPLSQNSKPTYLQNSTISDHRGTLIPSCLKFIIFPDDTNVFLSHRSITKLFEIMNYELLTVADGFNANKLVLSSGKINYVLFHSVGKKASSNAILINNKPLKQLESTKFLGVIIDSHLSWKDHITLITNKISRNLGIISRIKYCLPFHVLLNLYYSLIFPYLSYCNIVWGSNYVPIFSPWLSFRNGS